MVFLFILKSEENMEDMRKKTLGNIVKMRKDYVPVYS